MKRIEITKREQHVLMTCLRVLMDGLQDREGSGMAGTAVRAAMNLQPGIVVGDDSTKQAPSVAELDSILERLSSNEVT